MNFLFSPDGVLFSFLSKVLNILTVGIIFLVFCIPIVTIGASLSAFYSVLFKIAKNKEGYIFKQFLEAFRRDFKQSTIVFLISSIIFVVLYIDFFVCLNFFSGTVQATSFIVLFIISVLYFTMYNYLFPIISKFKNSNKGVFLNTFRIAFGNIIFSINIVFFSLFPIIALYFFRNSFILTALFWSFIIYIVSSYIKALLFINFFKQYELIKEVK